MELYHPTPVTVPHFHRVFRDSCDRRLGSTSTSSESSLLASSSNDTGSPYSGRSLTNPAVSSPPTSPVPSSSHTSPDSLGSQHQSPSECSRIRGSSRTRSRLPTTANADLDHLADSGKGLDEGASTKPNRLPPFYLIPTIPETADAILVIPGPGPSSWLSAPASPPPSIPPPTPSFPYDLSSYGFHTSNVGNTADEKSGCANLKSKRPPVRSSESRRHHQQHGLLFIGAAMAHVHAARRARRVPRGTRMRAFRVAWNESPRAMFSKADIVPVPMMRPA